MADDLYTLLVKRQGELRVAAGKPFYLTRRERFADYCRSVDWSWVGFVTCVVLATICFEVGPVLRILHQLSWI